MTNKKIKYIKILKIFTIIIVTSFLNYNNRPNAGTISNPAIKKYPINAIKNFISCSTYNETLQYELTFVSNFIEFNDLISRYEIEIEIEIIIEWFSLFKNLMVNSNIASVEQISSYDTLRKLISISNNVNNSLKSNSVYCQKAKIKMIELIYSQADLAFDWIEANRYHDKTKKIKEYKKRNLTEYEKNMEKIFKKIKSYETKIIK